MNWHSGPPGTFLKLKQPLHHHHHQKISYAPTAFKEHVYIFIFCHASGTLRSQHLKKLYAAFDLALAFALGFGFCSAYRRLIAFMQSLQLFTCSATILSSV